MTKSIIEEVILLAAGFGVIAEEKLNEYLTQAEKMGIIDKKEAKALAEKVMERQKKDHNALAKDIDKSISESLKSLGLVQKKDYDKLVEKLEKIKEGKKSAPKKKPKKKA